MKKKSAKKPKTLSAGNKKKLPKSVSSLSQKAVKKKTAARKKVSKKTVTSKTPPLKKTVKIKGAITTSLTSVQQAEAKRKQVKKPALNDEGKVKSARTRLKAAKPAEDFVKNIKKNVTARKQVQASKPVLPATRPAPVPLVQEEPVAGLPGGYGDNFIYLMVRDPFTIYVYWEIQANRQQEALNELGGSWDKVKSILRVHDLNQSKGFGYWDIYLNGMATSWFIEVSPNKSFYVEIGLLHEDGRFIVLAVSQQVTTPRIMPSEVLDEEWMGIDFDTIYALSGGFEAGKSSAELHRMMQDRLMNAVTSGSGSGSGGMPTSPAKIKKRGFWFHMDCEVIIHGATEPDAQVTFQGQPVRLRSDGTFSFRFPLPDGTHFYEAKAVSADGIEERAITPIVERNTQVSQPVIRFGQDI